MSLINKFSESHPGLLLNKLGLHVRLLENKNSLEVRPPASNFAGDRIQVIDEVCHIYQKSADQSPALYEALYGAFYQEWITCLLRLQKMKRARLAIAKLQSRFVMGLSGAAAMQTSFYLHHTYGVPVIPGSSVKGACRDVATNDMELIYGSQEKDTQLNKGAFQAGNVIFLDALPCIWKGLERDVMTPHHTKYYEDACGFEEAPDIENPVPVHFLAVPQGTCFIFAFLSEDATLLDEVERHWQLACNAGFGAKTSSGYGWFETVAMEIPQDLMQQKDRLKKATKKQPELNKPPDLLPQMLKNAGILNRKELQKYITGLIEHCLQISVEDFRQFEGAIKKRSDYPKNPYAKIEYIQPLGQLREKILNCKKKS